MTEKPCVFCQIVEGTERASVIYQDDLIMAFMTLHPTRPGEFLLIPKKHIDHFSDIPEDLACHIMKHTQRLSRNLMVCFKPKRVGLVVHGFGVPHAHLAVVPQHEPTDIVSGRHVIAESGQIRFGCKHLETPSRDELDRQARIIAKNTR